MKYCYKISKFKTFEKERFNELFPSHMSLQQDGDELSIIIDSKNQNEKKVFTELQQECDRIFFFTGEQLSPKFQWKRNPNGTTHRQFCLKSRLDIVRKMPENISKQLWKPSLSAQLRLWCLAQSPNLPIVAKINLLFQIIEITYPDKAQYPRYTDSNIPPDPKKESHLLRNLTSHGKGTIRGLQLKRYCEFLEINKTLHDPIDSNFTRAVKSRLKIIRQEAKKVIKAQITLKNNKKMIDDIDINKVDLGKHKIKIPAGTKLYRIVPKGADPLKPTGKASRFAKESSGYTFEKYQAALENGTAIHVGTGSTCYCEAISTAILEVNNKFQDKDIWKITLKSDIELIDMDSICKTEGVSKPYTAERTEIWHNFYGKKVNGLRYESSKNPTDYNIVIFPDWFKKFKEVVDAEKC